jgi:hypothetical protein
MSSAFSNLIRGPEFIRWRKLAEHFTLSKPRFLELVFLRITRQFKPLLGVVNGNIRKRRSHHEQRRSRWSQTIGRKPPKVTTNKFTERRTNYLAQRCSDKVRCPGYFGNGGQTGGSRSGFAEHLYPCLRSRSIAPLVPRCVAERALDRR